MASTPINVPDPVALPTAVQLAQIAANISTVMFAMTQQGKQYIDVYQAIGDLASAVNCCAQALLTINNTTPSSVGVVNVRNAYALGAAAVIPANISTRSV